MHDATQEWLNHLETRAGASDADTESWLAERRRGVTATQVAQLYLGSMTPDALAAQKFIERITPPERLARARPNRYMKWGKEREPIIAAEVHGLIPGLQHESRVFRSSANDRHLASPDMIGSIGDEQPKALAEIKTSTHYTFPGNAAFDRSGYLAQMQWQMYVLDADVCLYVLEQHKGFIEPQLGLHFKLIKRDDGMIQNLIELADAALTELDILGRTLNK